MDQLGAISVGKVSPCWFDSRKQTWQQQSTSPKSPALGWHPGCQLPVGGSLKGISLRRDDGEILRFAGPLWVRGGVKDELSCPSSGTHTCGAHAPCSPHTRRRAWLRCCALCPSSAPWTALQRHGTDDKETLGGTRSQSTCQGAACPCVCRHALALDHSLRSFPACGRVCPE